MIAMEMRCGVQKAESIGNRSAWDNRLLRGRDKGPGKGAGQGSGTGSGKTWSGLSLAKEMRRYPYHYHCQIW